jgi:hypothetical protein
MPARARARARALVAIAATALLCAPAPAAAEIKTDRERAIRIAAIAGAIGLYVASETVAKDALDPDECRWCNPGSFDDGLREVTVWSDPGRAKRLSDVVGYGVTPIGLAAMLLYAGGGVPEGRANRSLDDMITMFEIVWGTQLVTQAVKISAGRQRPYAHYYPIENPGEMLPLSQEDNLSFFSGHSSLTFSIAVGAGLIAHRRGYKLEPYIWGAGLALAASTAYLRMAADRHYFTDVLVGAAAGTLGAMFIPRLTGSLPGRASIVPQPNGVAISGRF